MPNKDPAFLFYSSDFLAGVQDLTMEERGVYITLICLQHQKGHLTKKMIDLCHGNATADVMAKFRQDPAGLWYNERLEKEIEKRREFSDKQSKRAKDGWNKRKEECHGNATAMPYENTIENVNRNDIEVKEKGVLGERKNFRYGFQRPGQSPEYFDHVWEYMQNNLSIFWEQAQMKYPNFKEGLKDFEEQNLQKMWKDPGDLRDHFKNFLIKKENIKNNLNGKPNNPSSEDRKQQFANAVQKRFQGDH